jgi:glycosyltransferase involved in cell wall biosynthesis
VKILIVSDAWHPQINGVVRTYEYMCEELAAMGHEVKVIGPGDLPFVVPMPGYSEIRLAMFAGAPLRKAIEAFSPDLLHIATEGPLGYTARRYAIKHAMPFTSCYHTHFPDYAAKRLAKFIPFLEGTIRKLGIAYVRHFHKPSACLFVATASLKSTLEQWGFTCPMKFMTRGFAPIFHAGDKTCFHDLPRPIALYVGRVAIEKNLEAFLGMNWSGSKVVIGKGPDLTHLQKEFPEAHFLGAQKGDALANFYRSADLFVFPSKTDTFGMVLVEALACGLPVAAYPVTGPIDIITQDYLGALDEDLEVACQKALQQADKTQARIDHTRLHYNWRQAAEQFLDY